MRHHRRTENSITNWKDNCIAMAIPCDGSPLFFSSFVIVVGWLVASGLVVAVVVENPLLIKFFDSLNRKVYEIGQDIDKGCMQ